MNKDQVKGKVKETVGKGQEALGEATDNPKTEAKGLAKQAEGKVQKEVGDAKETLRDATKRP